MDISQLAVVVDGETVLLRGEKDTLIATCPNRESAELIATALCLAQNRLRDETYVRLLR